MNDVGALSGTKIRVNLKLALYSSHAVIAVSCIISAFFVLLHSLYYLSLLVKDEMCKKWHKRKKKSSSLGLLAGTVPVFFLLFSVFFLVVSHSNWKKWYFYLWQCWFSVKFGIWQLMRMVKITQCLRTQKHTIFKKTSLLLKGISVDWIHIKLNITGKIDWRGSFCLFV